MNTGFADRGNGSETLIFIVGNRLEGSRVAQNEPCCTACLWGERSSYLEIVCWWPLCEGNFFAVNKVIHINHIEEVFPAILDIRDLAGPHQLSHSPGCLPQVVGSLGECVQSLAHRIRNPMCLCRLWSGAVLHWHVTWLLLYQIPSSGIPPVPSPVEDHKPVACPAFSRALSRSDFTL